MSPATESLACGGCGRAFDTARENCLYCGWHPGRVESTYGAIVDEGDHAQGTTLVRFAFGSLIFGPLATSLTSDALARGDVALLAAAMVAFALGPGVLALQIFRRSRGVVTTHTDGIAIGDDVVPWSDITSAQHVRGLFGGRDGYRSMAEVLRFTGRPSAMGLMLGRGAIGIVLGPILFLALVVAPAVGLLTPWHPRVVITKRNGEERVLHDLGEAQRFLRVVHAKLRTVPGAPLPA